MPTVKLSNEVYEILVRAAGNLQGEWGRMVTLDEALAHLFRQLHEWDINTKKLEKDIATLKETKQ